MMLGYSGDDEEDDEQPRARIARPQPNATPPLVLRGVAPPADSTDAMTANADKTRSLNSSALSETMQPSPLAQRRGKDEANYEHLQSTGSGISQIKNPYARNALRAVSAIGSAILPRTMGRIPGTEEHHNQLLGTARQNIAGDIEEQGKEATNAETQARIPLTEAQTGLTEQQTKNLANPQPKQGLTPEETTIHDLMMGENGQPRINPQTQKPFTYLEAYQAVKQAGQDVKPDAGRKTNDVPRVIGGVTHMIKVDAATGEDIKDLGPTKLPGESSEQKRTAQESAQVERESRGNIRKAEGEFRNTQKSVGQLSSAIDQAADGNGLLTSFVPTMEVLGINAANGVHRISPAEAQAANLPGGWSEQFNAWFDKAASGQISPQLKAEGKALAKMLLDSSYHRYKSTYDDENSIVSGYGGTGFNKRVPLIQQEGDQQGGGGSVKLTDNGVSYNIPADQVQAFKADHPDAK